MGNKIFVLSDNSKDSEVSLIKVKFNKLHHIDYCPNKPFNFIALWCNFNIYNNFC